MPNTFQHHLKRRIPNCGSSVGSLTATHVRAARCLIPERIYRLIGRAESHIHVNAFGRHRSPDLSVVSKHSPTQPNLQVRLSLVISDPLKKTKFSQSKSFISSKRPAVVTATANTCFVVYSSSLFD